MRSINILSFNKKRYQTLKYRAYAILLLSIILIATIQHMIYLSLMKKFNQLIQPTVQVAHSNPAKIKPNLILPNLYQLLILFESNQFKNTWLTQVIVKNNHVMLTGHTSDPGSFFQLKKNLQQSHFTPIQLALKPHQLFSIKLKSP